MRPGVRWSVCENLQEIEAELQISAHRLWWAVLAQPDPSHFFGPGRPVRSGK